MCGISRAREQLLLSQEDLSFVELVILLERLLAACLNTKNFLHFTHRVWVSVIMSLNRTIWSLQTYEVAYMSHFEK
jgi:hypothetical protein